MPSPPPTLSRFEITLPEIVSGPPEVMVTSSPAPTSLEIVTDLLPSMTRSVVLMAENVWLIVLLITTLPP